MVVALFLCSIFFILSQVSVTTTSPSVTVVGISALTTTMTFTMAVISVGLVAALDKHDWVLLPLLILKDTIRSVIGLATVPYSNLHPRCLLRLVLISLWVLFM